MKYRRAENGDIWRARTVVLAEEDKQKRRKVIEKDELVEFRFWSPACVRTRDGLYLKISEDEFYAGFDLVGKVFAEVYQRNDNTTAEILDARLYKKIELSS